MFGLDERVSEEGMTEVVSSLFACLVTGSLFVFSPLPMIVRRFRKSAMDDYHIYPFVACLSYTAVWYLYTCALDRYEFHYMCQFYCSFIGMCVLCTYSLVLADVAPPSDRISFAIMYKLTLDLILCILVVSVSQVVATYLFRLLVMVFGICMYASPLSTIENCRKSNVATYLPTWLCFALLLNGASWVTIAFVLSKPDLVITVTNGIGVVLALIELGMIYKFKLNFSTSSKGVDPHYDTKTVSFFKYFGNAYLISALVVAVAASCGYYQGWSHPSA